MRMGFRRGRAALSAVVVAVVVLAAVAPPVEAGGDQFQDSSVKTYELDPDKHVIHVTERFSFKNKAPGKSRSYDCSYWYNTPYGSIWIKRTCTTRTNYYYNSYKAWIENDARNLKVKGNSGSASVKRLKRDGDWREVKIGYSPLWYGKSRVITMTYDLPAAGPRESGQRYALQSFASFCAEGSGSDKGELRIVVPSGYVLTGTSGMKASSAGGKTTWSSGMLSTKPWEFDRCVRGENADAFTATDASTPDGLPITIAAWKDDPAWNQAVTTAVGTAQGVAAVLGVQDTQTPITIREVRGEVANTSMSGLGDTLSVNEQELDPAVIADALIHGTWFPATTWQHGWLQGGYELWAMDRAGVGTVPCEAPGAYPGGGDPDLSTWGLPAGATGTEKAVWTWKQQAACSIVAQVNEAIGPDGVAAVWTAINEGWDAWAPADDPQMRKANAIGWQDWTDIVTERGLVPAGADEDLAANLVVEYGVTADTGLMAERADARKALAAYKASNGGEAPVFIDEAVHTWAYAAASRAVATATAALDTAAATEAVMPEVAAAGGIVATAVAGATSQADLDAASALAADQLAAAKDVADAQALLAVPLDAVQQIGLAGSSVPTDDAAVAAVIAGDADAAGAAAGEIRDKLGGTSEAGVQRLAMGGGLIVAMLALVAAVAFVLRRRSRSRTAAPGA